MFSKLVPIAILVLGGATAGAQTVAVQRPAPKPAPVAPAAVVPPALLDLRIDIDDLALHALDVSIDPALDAVAMSLSSLEGAFGVQEAIAKERIKVPIVMKRDRETSEYDRGTRALDRGRYEDAVAAFERVVSLGGGRTEGALYWQAYSLSRLGRRAEALTRLDELEKKFPSGRWANDARALRLDVRQASGQPISPEAAQDEELKAMALRAVIRNDPERAVPMVEEILKGSAAPKLKEQALFVLAQSGSPQAREILGRVARGQGNPDVQLKAVRYLAMFGGQESRHVLSEVYAQSSDIDVKRQVLQAFMLAGDRDRLVTAARSEKSPELRAEAVRQLGVMGARTELGELYKAEVSVKVKEELLNSFFLSGASEKLLAAAKTEADSALREKAVRNLGMMDSTKTGDALLQFYREDKDPSVKRAAIQGLFIQQNAAALVTLARQETNPELKKELVSKLSLMQNKEAVDYMMELLK